MEIIKTINAPVPGGHYSQAIKHGDFIFISGQLPIDAHTGEKNTGLIEVQTHLVLENILAIAEAAGSDKNHIVKITVFISDISLWSEVNEVFAQFFGDHRPARAIVPTKDLHYNLLIEMDAVAVVSGLN